jgi:hypothetical protein
LPVEIHKFYHFGIVKTSEDVYLEMGFSMSLDNRFPEVYLAVNYGAGELCLIRTTKFYPVPLSRSVGTKKGDPILKVYSFDS